MSTSQLRPALPIDHAPSRRPISPSAHRFGELASILAWLADDPDNSVESYPGPNWGVHADPEGWPDWTDDHVWSAAATE